MVFFHGRKMGPALVAGACLALGLWAVRYLDNLTSPAPFSPRKSALQIAILLLVAIAVGMNVPELSDLARRLAS
ncbi:hypothetical protein GCM10009612_14360 [Streptomyces beijiangensis]